MGFGNKSKHSPAQCRAVNLIQEGFKMSSSITINGQTYTGKKSVQIINNRIMIDGVDVSPKAKQITIQITGDVSHLSVDACETLTITGNAGEVQTQSGNVYCGNVQRKVETMSGNVSCGTIHGNVTTMSGNIQSKKV
jgi:hypothetical protein